MPRGVPTLGQAAMDDHESKLSEEFPGGEVLGEIKSKPSGVATWSDPDTDALIQMEQGPAPWEMVSENPSDARSFISCPDDWCLRWINPRLLNQEGWRGWKPVRAKDPRVKVKVESMISPEYQIRRGGHDGDILAYMPKHWFESKKKHYYEMVRARTQASVDRAANLRDEVARIHPGFHVESVKHPTHTITDLPRGLQD